MKQSTQSVTCRYCSSWSMRKYDHRIPLSRPISSGLPQYYVEFLDCYNMTAGILTPSFCSAQVSDKVNFVSFLNSNWNRKQKMMTANEICHSQMDSVENPYESNQMITWVQSNNACWFETTNLWLLSYGLQIMVGLSMVLSITTDNWRSVTDDEQRQLLYSHVYSSLLHVLTSCCLVWWIVYSHWPL